MVDMKVLGKSSLSSKIKLGLDAMWFVGCAGVGIWILFAFFLLSGKFFCAENESCNMNASIDSIGFKMDSKSSQLQSLNGGTAYFSEGSGKLTIKGQINKATSIALVIEGGVLGFLFLIAIWHLRRLFKTFVLGAPFTEANVKTIRLISFSIFGISIFSSLSSVINAFLLNQQFSGEGIHLVANGDLNMSSIFSAIVIFILAEIFRLGSQLEDEKAYTV